MKIVRHIPLLVISFWFTSCATFISHAISLEDVAPPSGTYTVGTQIIHMVDKDRIAWYKDGLNSPREMMVRVWYPAVWKDGYPVSYTHLTLPTIYSV